MKHPPVGSKAFNDLLRALEKEATPKPWRHADSVVLSGDDVVFGLANSDFIPSQDKYNAEFAASTRNILPSLLDELERLQKVEEAAKAQREHVTALRYIDEDPVCFVQDVLDYVLRGGSTK